MLASVNDLGLRPENRRANICCDVLHIGIDVCCIQETRFSTLGRKYFLTGRFLYLACLDGRSGSVSWIVSKSLNIAYALVVQDSVGKHCMLDDTIEASLIDSSTPTDHAERPDFSVDRTDLATSRREVSVGDWKAVLDLDIDLIGVRSGHVDKYRNEHPGR